MHFYSPGAVGTTKREDIKQKQKLGKNNWILVIHEPAGLDHSANMLSDHSFNNWVSHTVFLESGNQVSTLIVLYNS